MPNFRVDPIAVRVSAALLGIFAFGVLFGWIIWGPVSEQSQDDGWPAGMAHPADPPSEAPGR